MKKVFLTGATGFIGSHAIAPLLKNGYEVHAVSSLISNKQTEGVFWHQLNLFDSLAVKQLLDEIRPSHLLHFAWIAKPGKLWSSIDNLSWVEASLHLIRTFQACGGKRVVVSGSCAEYEWNQQLYSETTSSFRPATMYGVCKRSLSQILAQFSKETQISLAWGYIFFVLGPKENPQRFVPSIIRGLLQKREVPCSSGIQIRDFLDVRDIAHAFATLLDSKIEGGINIGSGNGIRLKQIGEKIGSLIGNPELLQFGALTPPTTEPPEIVADTRRLKEELMWRPIYSIDQSIEDAISWWKSNL